MHKTGAWWFVRRAEEAELELDLLASPPTWPSRPTSFMLVVDSPSRAVTARIPLSHPFETSRFLGLLTISSRGIGTLRVSTDEEFQALIGSEGWP
jgi:hypothetical protein